MNRGKGGPAYVIGYALGLALMLLFLASVLFLAVELLRHVVAALGGSA